MTAFDISIILAEAQGRPDLGPALLSIERSCAGIAAEVVVVRPPGRAPVPRSNTVTIREVTAAESLLVPERWGLGVRAAQAPVFACLTTEFTVQPEWARALLDGLADGAVGAAGAIELAPGAGTTATAVYLVRFSAYMPRATAGARSVGNIPGDAAAYRREPVAAFPDLLAAGFWEIEFHHRFTAQGSRLLLLGHKLATFHSTRSLRASLLLRFRHGRNHGVTRVRRHRHTAWRLLLLSPLVPVVLLARIVRRTVGTAGGPRMVIRSLPALALISVAWAAGEAAGAWSARDRR